MTVGEEPEIDLAPLRRAEAAFRLEVSEWTRPDVVAAAVDLLARGVDGESLTILAGEDHADPREVEHFLNLTLADLGLEPLDPLAALLYLFDAIAADVLAGRIEPASAARRVWRLRTQVRFPTDIGTAASGFAGAAVEIDDLPNQVVGGAAGGMRHAAEWYLAQRRGESTPPADRPARDIR